MTQTLSHTVVLHARPPLTSFGTYAACNSSISMSFCAMCCQSAHFQRVDYERGHGMLGSIRDIVLGPPIAIHLENIFHLKELLDKCDGATKTLSYTVLEGDSRYITFRTMIRFVEKDATVTEATWTAKFVPRGEMGPPEHFKPVAEFVFQALEKAVQMQKTFTHTETLDVSPVALWKACKQADKILLEQMPQHFEASTMIEGFGGPGTVRIIKFGPERVDFIKRKEKRMGYTVLKGDPRYKYLSATTHFGAGTSAVWKATCMSDGDMGRPEHFRDVATSVWKALTLAVKANPERYA